MSEIFRLQKKSSLKPCRSNFLVLVCYCEEISDMFLSVEQASALAVKRRDMSLRFQRVHCSARQVLYQSIECPKRERSLIYDIVSLQWGDQKAAVINDVHICMYDVMFWCDKQPQWSTLWSKMSSIQCKTHLQHKLRLLLVRSTPTLVNKSLKITKFQLREAKEKIERYDI